MNEQVTEEATKPRVMDVLVSKHELRVLVSEHRRHATELREIAGWLLADEDDYEGAQQFRRLAERRERRATQLEAIANEMAGMRNVP